MNWGKRGWRVFQNHLKLNSKILCGFFLRPKVIAEQWKIISRHKQKSLKVKFKENQDTREMFSKFAKLRKVWKGNSRKIRTQGTGTDFFEAGSLSRPQSVFNVGPELTPCPYLCRNCLPENWHQRAEANCYADTFAVHIMHLKSTDELVCLWNNFRSKFVPQLSLCKMSCCPSVV